jgi:hypothetical protein
LASLGLWTLKSVELVPDRTQDAFFGWNKKLFKSAMNQTIIDWDELTKEFIFLEKCFAEGEGRYWVF